MWLEGKYPHTSPWKPKEGKAVDVQESEPGGCLPWGEFWARDALPFSQRIRAGLGEWITPSGNKRMAQMTFSAYMPPCVPIPYATPLTPWPATGRTGLSQPQNPGDKAPQALSVPFSIPVSSLDNSGFNPKDPESWSSWRSWREPPPVPIGHIRA